MSQRRLTLALAGGVALIACVLPARAQDATPRTIAVPILMYHVIAQPPPNAPFPALYVRPSEFAAQIGWLADHGYHGVTLSEVYSHWRYGKPLPPRPIVLTFDDGYRSVFERARPILGRQRWPGVLNLEVRFMNKPWGLARSRIQVLLRSGWELASHTITHPDLTSVSAAQLRQEVSGSRARLRQTFHVPVAFFCYPAGRYDARAVAAVQTARYLGATSTRPGLARPDELWNLARIRIDRGDGLAGLRDKLAAAGA